jgi:FKBP-type peptidyl-prolyl cis-trans isomerase (trigger factor)
MTNVRLGDRVRIQYCRLPEQAGAPGGTRRQQTIEFVVGSRDVFHALSIGVVGMAPGERKKFIFQPHVGHGPS